MLAISSQHGSIFTNHEIFETALTALNKLFDNLLAASMIPQEMVEIYFKLLKQLA
jgi:hypothetical protein